MKKNILFILAAFALIGCSSKETSATQEEDLDGKNRAYLL